MDERRGKEGDWFLKKKWIRYLRVTAQCCQETKIGKNSKSRHLISNNFFRLQALFPLLKKSTKNLPTSNYTTVVYFYGLVVCCAKHKLGLQ